MFLGQLTGAIAFIHGVDHDFFLIEIVILAEFSGLNLANYESSANMTVNLLLAKSTSYLHYFLRLIKLTQNATIALCV